MSMRPRENVAAAVAATSTPAAALAVVLVNNYALTVGSSKPLPKCARRCWKGGWNEQLTSRSSSHMRWLKHYPNTLKENG